MPRFTNLEDELLREHSRRHADRIAAWAGADPGFPIAVKVYAMTVLDRIARREPALRDELKLVIEQQLPFASCGFRARAREILRRS